MSRTIWKAAVSTAAFCILAAGCSDDATDARSPEARKASRAMGADFDRAARADPNSEPLPVDPARARVDPLAEPVAVN